MRKHEIPFFFPPQICVFSAAADADNLKLHQSNFGLSAAKGRFALSRSRRRCFLLLFLRTGDKLHFYSLGTNLRRKHGVSRGEHPLGSGFPIGARSIPVGTRFCSAKSSVLYLLRPLPRERGCQLGPPQNRRFCGERRSSGVNESCRLRRDE